MIQAMQIMRTPCMCRDGFTGVWVCVWRGGGVLFVMMKPKNIRNKMRYSNLNNNMMIQQCGGHFAKYWGAEIFNMYAFGVGLKYANLSNIMLGISNSSFDILLNSSFENTNSRFENTNSSFQNTNSSFQNTRSR